MNEPLYMKLRETKEHPEVKVALYRLKLVESAKALNELYVLEGSSLKVFSESDLKDLPTLYALLKQRSKDRILDPNGYLGFANHNESCKILEQLGLELIEQINHVRMLEALMLGIEGTEKVEDENGNGIHPKLLQAVYDDIAKKVDPYRAEWLNAKFEFDFSGGHLIKQKLKDGRLEEVKKELHPDTLMEYRRINLRDLVKYHTPQGFPAKDIPEGNDINFYGPQGNSVARLSANSVRFILGCNRYPLVSGPSLGMRSQKF